MSLSTEQRHRTAAELRANLQLAGVTESHLRADTDLDEHEFREAMHVSSRSRPEHVWLLRDRLVVLVHAAGRQPVPFTVLTEDMRAAASVRFPLR
ncbi:DUF2316 family protein [Jatrophihabitans endophyticus]|uniref:DUF2316 family protein n=1 Tax=Jatrophihabitans endophyticus TaxID=1206085 RepID=UPI001A07A394|nr:DUF2316 family protein [Jatrophihabitans endophyticus]MBE7190456.1 DUF2316 family protein [Jatrophihabitans endophyticus]